MQIGDTRGHADLGARVFAKNGGKQQRTAGNSKEQQKFCCSLSWQMVADPGFPPKMKSCSLLICRQNSKNSETGSASRGPAFAHCDLSQPE
jgi:hypothetical protein